MIKILDTTMREGEQTFGVKFTKRQKIILAKLLDEFGIDIIEIGHPFVSSQDFEKVKAVSKLKLTAETLGHARAKREDVQRVVEAGTDWVGIFAGINDYSLEYKLKRSQQDATAMIVEAIEYAKESGLKVRYSIEDSTRTEPGQVMSIAKAAKKAGADVIGLPDTTGSATPENYSKLVSMVIKKVNIPVEVHCHNDFGLALANSLAAYKAGAQIIDVSVNGLGERAGLTSLAELCTSLKFLYNEEKNWKLEELPKISAITQRFSRTKLDHLRSVVGKNAFTHTARLHVNAVKNEPRCYESINPFSVGRKRVLM